MSASKLAQGSLLVLVISCFVGCATPPDAELEAARTALQEAQAAGAEEYSISEYEGAQTVLADAEAEIAEKNYEAAREFLVEASRLANEAAAAVPAAKEGVREGIATTLDEFRSLLQRSNAALLSLEKCSKRKTKDLELDLDLARSRYVEASASLEAIQAMEASGDLLAALHDAEVAVEEIELEVEQAETAVADTGC